MMKDESPKIVPFSEVKVNSRFIFNHKEYRKINNLGMVITLINSVRLDNNTQVHIPFKTPVQLIEEKNDDESHTTDNQSVV